MSSSRPGLTVESFERVIDVASSRPSWFGEAIAFVAFVAGGYELASPSQRSKIRVAATGLAGLIERRKIRTGVTASVYDADEAGLDASDGRYVVVCEDHSMTLGGVTSLRLARARMTDTSEWCAHCRGSD